MQTKGSVVLVGAGPGDPALLTIGGKKALESADVVLFDRLVGDGILAMIPQNAELVDVGKSSGNHLVPQEEINTLILGFAREGKRVVRLKGGDPYLFGRGAEELEAIVEEGIPFRVIPGITSAIAAPCYGGIPVSHREMASSVHIITGHLRQGAVPAIDYPSLIKLSGTLIFLMGVGALPDLTAGLVKAGMNPATPAALVENGTRPNQRRLVATVETIVAKAAEQGYHPPSVFIVGEVCSLAGDLDWFTRQPLSGVRVLVTRPKASAGTLTSRLREDGCDVIEYPCIRTQPLAVDKAVFHNLVRYHWIVFTSPVGAAGFFQRLAEQSVDVRSLNGIKFAAVGEKTASELTARGILPELVPSTYDAEALAQELLKQAEPGQRILLYRAKVANATLPAALREKGLTVDDVAAYETLYEHPNAPRVAELLKKGAIDYVTFTSESTVEGFVRSLPDFDPSAFTGICIGASTAAAAKKHGIRVMVSEAATIDSMIACIHRAKAEAASCL